MRKPLPLISVCVCTHNRQELLQVLLNSLFKMRTDGLFDVEIIVVDNGHSPASLNFDSSLVNIKRFCKVRLKGQSNISRARNACLEHAKGEYIAFIDDDEFVCADWLLEHYKALQSADVSHGYTTYYLHEKGDLKPKSIYESLNPSNSRSKWYPRSTQNVCMRRHILAELDHFFDEQFGTTGGEDSDFFLRLEKKGRFKFAWTGTARAFEIIHPHRVSFLRQFKRRFHHGRTHVLIRRKNETNPKFLAASIESLKMHITRVLDKNSCSFTVAQSWFSIAFRFGVLLSIIFKPRRPRQYNL